MSVFLHVFCAVLSPLACLALKHIFVYYLINGTICGKKVVEHKMCV